jgi:nitrate reductase delta subunit
MSELSLYAEALSYPVPGRIEKWMAGLGRSAQSAGVAEFAAFVQALLPLSQGELEELYTRTLDLNPEIAPYLGYQMWGDSYKRGN